MIAKTEMCRKIQVNQSRETLEKKKKLGKWNYSE